MNKKNKKILVLGASSDIGFRVLNLLNSKGYQIGAHCNTNDKILKKYQKNTKSKFKIFKKKLINQKDSVDLINSFLKWSGNIDVLVHLTGNVSKVSHWTKIKQSNLIEDFKINFSSTFFVVQKVFNAMKKNKGGKIILAGTSSATHGGGEDSFGYGLSKLNLIYLSKAVARIGGKYNIICNCVNPGYINTKFHSKVMKRSKKSLEIRKTKTKLGRSGQPEEIAEFINFLISDKTDFFTGQNLNIDGGDWI